MDLIITRPPLDLRTVVIAAFCLLGAGFAGYLFYLDTHGNPVRGQGAPMGVVEKSESFVRRKLSDSYLWDPIGSKDKLYRHDSIQTGPESSARIRLNDGSIVELGEESLVVIDDQAKMSLNFVRGSAVVHDNGGDRAVRVRRDGRAQVETIAARLETPEAFARLYARSGIRRSVQFRWALRNPPRLTSATETPTLEISTNRVFSRGSTRAFSVRAESPSGLSVELAPGVYFWRLLRAGASISDTRRFEIDEVRPLRPLAPTMAQAIQRRSASDLVQFRWSASVTAIQAGESRIEISPDPTFLRLSGSFPIVPQSLMAAIPGLADGYYFWRIRTRLPGIDVTSDPVEFRVVDSGTPILAVLQPASNAKVGLGTEVAFSWRLDGAPQATDFSWELEEAQAASPTGKAEVKSFRDKAPFHSWIPERPGAYRWRARALKDGKVIAESDWRDLEVEDQSPIGLVFPAESQVIGFWKPPVQLRLRWQGPPLPPGKGGFYELEVASDPELRTLITIEKTMSPDFDGGKLRLREGIYFWRVRLLDGSGRRLHSSVVGRFSCAVNPPLAPPSRLIPPSGAVYRLNAMDRAPAVTWAPVAGAAGYVVTFYSSGKIYLQERVRGNRFSLAHPHQGEYTWNVRSIDPLGRDGPESPLNHISISTGKVLPPPEVLQRTRVVE